MLRPAQECYVVAEVVAGVFGRLANLTEGSSLSAIVEPKLPLLYFDYVDIVQAQLTPGDNAAKNAGAVTLIEVSAGRVPGGFEFAVQDRGPSIQPH